MPAKPSLRRRSDCFSRVLGMNGLAAAWPIFWSIGATPPLAGCCFSTTDSVGAALAVSRLRSLLSPWPPTSNRERKNAIAATAANTNTMTKSVSFILHLHRRQLADRVQPGHLEPERGPEHLL